MDLNRLNLSQDRVALLDDADFEIARKHKWYFNGRYVVRTRQPDDPPSPATILLHRVLGKKPSDIKILLRTELPPDPVPESKLDRRNRLRRELRRRQRGYLAVKSAEARNLYLRPTP